MAIFIVKKSQLLEYVERKRARRVYESIMVEIHNNSKYLNENVSLKNVNQNVIDNYNRKKMITPRVFQMLKENKIISNNYEIL